METLVTVLIILGAIALGALILHLVNVQREERIASHHYPSSGRGKDSGRPGPPGG